MAENEGMEGKNLANERRKMAQKEFLEEVKDLKEGENITSLEGLVVTKTKEQYIISMRRITFGIANKDGTFIYRNKLANLENNLNKEGLSLRNLNLPGLEEALDRELEAKEQAENQLKVENDNLNSEGQDTEVGDKKPELEESKEKEQISKEYRIPLGQIVHFMPHSKNITKDENLAELSYVFDGYDEVLSFPETENTQKFVGIKNGKQEEIAYDDKQIWGKNPNVKIKLIGEEQILTDVKILSIYELNENGDAMAFVRNEHGEIDALYCRPEVGDPRSYLASKIPEASVKNVEQKPPEIREAISRKYNSPRDLNKLADRIEEQEQLEKQGLESGKQGAELNEIKDKDKMHENNINIIIERLNENGIKDEPHGKCQYLAEKVLDKMKKDGKKIEDAIEEVINEGQKEPGGRTPGDRRTRRGA